MAFDSHRFSSRVYSASGVPQRFADVIAEGD
jgi:hypothetical protein